MMDDRYRIYPKYSDTLSTYNTCPKTWNSPFYYLLIEVVGWYEGVMYLMSPGRPADIGLQLGKACYPCSR